MFPDDPNFSWLKVLAFGAFAGFGGMMGHLMRTIDSGEKVTWGKAILEGLSAGFVGLCMLMACEALGLDNSWTGVIVGVSGWMGAPMTIRVLESLMLKRLGLTKEEVRDDSSKRD